jgi:hypothetical protein
MKRPKKMLLSVATGLAGAFGCATVVFLFLVWKTGLGSTGDYFARNPGIVLRAMAPIGVSLLSPTFKILDGLGFLKEIAHSAVVRVNWQSPSTANSMSDESCVQTDESFFDLTRQLLGRWRRRGANQRWDRDPELEN